MVGGLVRAGEWGEQVLLAAVVDDQRGRPEPAVLGRVPAPGDPQQGSARRGRDVLERLDLEIDQRRGFSP